MRAVEEKPQGKKKNQDEVIGKIDKRATNKELFEKKLRNTPKRSRKAVLCANLEAVAGLRLVDELISAEGGRHRGEKTLDNIVAAVHIKQSSNHSGKASWVDLSWGSRKV